MRILTHNQNSTASSQNDTVILKIAKDVLHCQKNWIQKNARPPENHIKFVHAQQQVTKFNDPSKESLGGIPSKSHKKWRILIWLEPTRNPPLLRFWYNSRLSLTSQLGFVTKNGTAAYFLRIKAFLREGGGGAIWDFLKRGDQGQPSYNI